MSLQVLLSILAGLGIDYVAVKKGASISAVAPVAEQDLVFWRFDQAEVIHLAYVPVSLTVKRNPAHVCAGELGYLDTVFLDPA